MLIKTPQGRLFDPNKKKFVVPRKIDITRINFPRFILNEANEKLVRETIFKHWVPYYAKRRKRDLAQLKKLDEDSKEYRSIARKKFVRVKHPTDLSGACKISSQIALIVFPIRGQVISNKNHSFILTTKDQIYDLNRNCGDVSRLLKKGRHAYGIDLEYNEKSNPIKGLRGWNTFIIKVLNDLQVIATSMKAEHLSQGLPEIEEVPDWAKVNLNPMTMQLQEVSNVKKV